MHTKVFVLDEEIRMFIPRLMVITRINAVNA